MANEFDTHMFGTVITTQAEYVEQVYALATAIENGMFDVADQIMSEILADGPDSVKAVIYSLVGSFMGALSLLETISGMDHGNFLSSLATNNSLKLEIGREILRAAENTDPKP